MRKKCGWCGEVKEVFAYREVDFEEVEDVPLNDLIIEGKEPLKDNDVVGIPICKECHSFCQGDVSDA